MQTTVKANCPDELPEGKANSREKELKVVDWDTPRGRSMKEEETEPVK